MTKVAHLFVVVSACVFAAFGDMFNPPEYVGPVDAAHAPKMRRLITSPSIAVADNGRLWATWFSSPQPRENTNTYVVLSTSIDDGRTWQECAIVDPDGTGPRRAFDPQVWVTPDKRLAWTWTDRTGGKGCQITDGLWISYLADASQPFTEMTVPRCIAHGIMNNSPTVLSDGTWVFPVCVWHAAKSAGMYVSQDAGKTWRFRDGATIEYVPDRNFDEHPIIEMKNGDLWALSRCISGIRRAISKDKGHSWTPSEPFPDGRVKHTPSRFVFMRLQSGNILFIKHGPVSANVGRKQLTAYVSRDEGETWEGGLMIDERDRAAYPIACQRKDGLIYCTYDHDRVGQMNVLFATFTEEDVLAGKDVSGKVRLRQVISTKRQ